MTTSYERICASLRDSYDVAPHPFSAGGSGEVYWATPTDDGDTTLVLKILHEKTLEDPEEHSRFRQEIRLSNAFNHAHLMPVLDSGETNEGDLWYVAPKASTNLSDHVPRGGIAPVDAVSILEQISDGLTYVHDSGSVHRDLSPGNVMLLDRRWVIADFGLAVSDTIHRTFATSSSASQFGTRDFAAPEQLERLKSATRQSDIYSLGKLLQFMLAGTVSSFGPAQGTPARTSILRATAEQPNLRFTTAHDLVAAVRRELTNPAFDASSRADVAERYIELLDARRLPQAETLPMLEWLDGLEVHAEPDRGWLLKIITLVDAREVSHVSRLDRPLVRRVVALVGEAIDLESFALDSRLERLAANLTGIATRCNDVEVTRLTVEAVATLGARHNRYAVRRALVAFLTKFTDPDMVNAVVSALSASEQTHWVFEETNIDSLAAPLRRRVRELMS